MKKKIIDFSDVEKILKLLKKKGKKIVHCHGVFDLLHIGHLKHFESAKKYGDILIVTLTPDAYVDKGPKRPAFSEKLRLESIASLDVVDYVALNSSPTAISAIKKIKPNIYCKGPDYKDHKNDIINDNSQMICKSCGNNLSHRGSCSFVGCHIPANQQKVEFNCSAVFQMEDETYGANIYVKDLNICRNILYLLSDIEWKLILKTVEQKGEVVYLSKQKKRAMENCSEQMSDIYAGTQACFTMFCEVYPLTNYSQFLCKLRPFCNRKQSQSVW